MNKDKEDFSPMDLLEDPVEGIQYIIPKIDFSLKPNKKQECRDILKEIKNFGVSQKQILFIIELLSMELENMEGIKVIKESVDKYKEMFNGENNSKNIKNKIILE